MTKNDDAMTNAGVVQEDRIRCSSFRNGVERQRAPKTLVMTKVRAAKTQGIPSLLVSIREFDGGAGEAGRDTAELTRWPKERTLSELDRMSKPLPLVEFDGRSAVVLLNHCRHIHT